MIKIIVTTLALIASATSGAQLTHSANSPLLAGTKSAKKNLSTEDNYNLTLKKEALGHFFLLKTSLIDSPPAPTGNPMASKVIFFKKSGPFIGMFESTSGKVVTDSVKTQILLAKFPILNETNTSITFNFEEGMKTLFLKGSYYIAREGSDPSKESSYIVHESFLNKVELVNKHIFIEQFLRVETPASGKEPAEISPVHIKYDFSTYTKNENFTPTPSPGFYNVGYFENHPIYPVDADGNINEYTATYIKKFDISKPVTYYITDNTPAKWRAAVEEGVLYWNKAFGREVLKVAALPKDASIFEPGYNIVQWLDWDTAGFAYAATSSDPLTGEVQNAHVFMTSSFAIGSYQTAKTYFERFKKEDHTNKKVFGLKGFASAITCENSEQRAEADLERFNALVETMEEKELSEQEKEIIYTRYVADYIREVVAHEVGHTLGFRHNFAASLDTNIDSKNYDKISKHYLLTGEVDSEVIPGSSVMDYTPGFFSSLAGAKIRLEESALLYDQHVVDVAYKGASSYSNLHFCTDDHAGEFFDCYRFDAFNNVLEEKKYGSERSMKNIAHGLLKDTFNFLSNDQLTHEEKISKFDTIYLNGTSDGLYMAKNRFKELALRAKKGAKSIKSGSNLETEFLKIGGLSHNLIEFITPKKKEGILLSDYSRMFITHFLDLSKSYYQEYLTPELEEKLNEAAKKYALEMESSFLYEALPHITTEFHYKDDNFNKDFSNLVKVLFSTKSEEELVQGIYTPYYNYKAGEKSLRKRASAFLHFDFFPKSYSFKRTIKNLKSELAEDLSQLESMISSLYGSLEQAPDAIYDYFFQEKEEIYRN